MDSHNATDNEDNSQSVPITIEMIIDVRKLRQQCEWLLTQSCEEAEGLIGIVNAIQDHLADVMNISDSDVFPGMTDAEDV